MGNASSLDEWPAQSDTDHNIPIRRPVTPPDSKAKPPKTPDTGRAVSAKGTPPKRSPSANSRLSVQSAESYKPPKSAPKENGRMFSRGSHSQEPDEESENAHNTPLTESPPEQRPTSAVNDELFKSLEDRSLSFEEALEKIEPVMRNLKKMRGVGHYNSAMGFFFLQKYSGTSTPEKRRRLWMGKLNEMGIAELTKKLWPSFENPDFLVIDPGAQGAASKTYNYQSFHFLWSILWNGSDCTVELSKAIANNDLLEVNLAILKREDFKPDSLQTDSERQWITKATLGVIHNCLRLNTIPSKRRLRQADCITILRNYLKSDVPLVRTKASIILAYVAEENEMEIIDAKDDIIHIMVRVLLEPALRSPKRRSMGFSVEETVDALNALAKHDENKRRMVKAGVIPMFMFILKKPHTEQELFYAVKGLWMLSFIPESVEAMKKNPDCVPALTTLKTHSNQLVCKAAHGALWNLSPPAVPASTSPVPERAKTAPNSKEDTSSTTVARPVTAPETEGAHVMISYDHIHVEVVTRLNAGLREAGYKTWIDFEHMHGSTLDAMAKAVETAAVILLCFSERYQESPNCRLEAEYAFKCQKEVVPVRTERFRPTGWLSMLLGSRFWVNCYVNEDVPDSIPKLIKELGGRGRGDSAPPAHTELPGSVRQNKERNDPPKSKGGKPLEQWTHAEVQKWLVKNELGHVGGNLSKFDGALMAQFRSMYRNSPGVQFYDSAKTFLNINDLADLLKLTAKLETI